MSVNKNVHDVEVALGLATGELVEEGVKLEKYTPEWFKAKGQEFSEVDKETLKLYDDFQSKFGATALAALSGENILKALFLGGNTDNLCHELEYVKKNNDLFSSIKGGNSYKYPLFFDKGTSTWTTGTISNPVGLSLADAIVKGTTVRDGLIKGLEVIESAKPIETVADYFALYTKLYKAIPGLVDSMWVIKYFHMMFPKLIPVFYSKDWQEKVLKVIKLNPADSTYVRLGQINEFVRKCEISNVVFAQVFYNYCNDVDSQEDIVSDTAISNERIKGGENIILYGVPGAGKSWTIKNEYCSDETCMERLVFHPDYTYSDFVGQIMPKVTNEGTVSYEFSPGPFTKLVKKAYANPDKMFFLVIEEVNRGNAPAIFGDVFQLLDRQGQYIRNQVTGQLLENPNFGASEYEITNADVAKVVYGNENHKVYIPSNMSIICTMNTSDQNVFTLDSAFQRRWSMRLIQNKFPEDGSEKALADTRILDTDVTWEKFFTVINDLILNKNIRMTSAEDKRLGTHFVSQEDLVIDTYDGNDKELIKKANRQNRKFTEKVLKYLWDDAFKFNKDEIFDINKVNSLEKVIEVFVNAKKNARFEEIFKQNIVDALLSKEQ